MTFNFAQLTNSCTAVPDFRSDDGLFNRLKKQHNLKASGKEMFDASVYRNDASTSSFHDMIRSLAEHSSKAQPTAFHHLLARLAKEKRLLRLYTQNVDEIDTSMPPLETSIPLGPKGPWPKTIQLHGGLRKMVCQKCRHIADLECDLFKGPVPPLCPTCAEVDDVRQASGQRSHGVGRLRPRMVLYNEHNPDDEAIGSVMMADLRARPDAVIVVGTSLKIPGVKRFLKECVGVVRSRRNGISMWINRDPVPTEKNFDDCWDLVVKADCDEVARRAALKRWDDESDEIFDCTSSDVEQAKARGQVSVVVTPRKQLTSKLPFNEKTGMMTPSSQDERSGSTQRKLNFGPATQKEAREDLLLKTAAILTSASNAKPQSKATLPKKKPATTTKKATAPTKRKPAIKKRDTTTKETTAKISNRFTVSKSTNKSTTSKSASNISVEITGVKHAANSGAASPMSHISPTDARSNGPVKEEDDETLVWKEGKEKRVVSPMDLRQMLN